MYKIDQVLKGLTGGSDIWLIITMPVEVIT
jgi:hypothetical protein